MATNYPLPSWVGPQAAEVWQGFLQEGARMGFNRAQLAAQAKEQAVREAQWEAEMQARQQAQYERNLREQHELEVDTAYKEALIGLKARDLAQEAQRDQAKILQTAEQAAARMTLTQKLASATTDEERVAVLMKYAIPAGGSPNEVMETIQHFSRRATGPVQLNEVFGPDKKRIPGFGANEGKIVKLPTEGLTENQRIIERNRAIAAQKIIANPDADPQAKALAQRQLDEIQGMLGEGFTPVVTTEKRSALGMDWLRPDVTTTNYVSGPLQPRPIQPAPSPAPPAYNSQVKRKTYTRDGKLIQ